MCVDFVLLVSNNSLIVNLLNPFLSQKGAASCSRIAPALLRAPLQKSLKHYLVGFADVYDYTVENQAFNSRLRLLKTTLNDNAQILVSRIQLLPLKAKCALVENANFKAWLQVIFLFDNLFPNILGRDANPLCG